MRITRILVSIGALLPALASLSSLAQAPQAAGKTHVMTNLSEVKWVDGPPVLPKGGKMFVLSGDPASTGPYVILSKLPAGYKIPPHWHPTDENVTVLSGTLSMGMGDAYDQKSLTNLRAGGYALMPANMRHFAYTKGGAVLQVQGIGPFSITYIDPKDDPRGAAAPAAK